MKVTQTNKQTNKNRKRIINIIDKHIQPRKIQVLQTLQS